jgi:glutamine amidotransferase
MMIAIVDYNVGNLLSAQKAFDYLGQDTVVTADEKTLRGASAIVLPGVGAFPDAMDNLRSRGLDGIIKDEVRRGKPLLGICLGMQLLFDEGEEIRKTRGLGLVPGRVRLMKTPYKIPHMGWNALSFHTPNVLFDGVAEGSYVYFVHSFCADAGLEKDLTASCEYGERLTAAVCHENVLGTQFHPEKSSRAGLKMLENFCAFINKV